MESSRLEQPLFTPTTKAQSGHDIPISVNKAKELIGRSILEKVEELSLNIFDYATKQLEQCGLILADTKFEFGMIGDELILIDEVLTPDSSRFWPAADYAPGSSPLSFDKQFVRDYLETLDWDKTPPGPSLPTEIIEKSREKYLEAYSLLTGEELSV